MIFIFFYSDFCFLSSFPKLVNQLTNSIRPYFLLFYFLNYILDTRYSILIRLLSLSFLTLRSTLYATRYFSPRYTLVCTRHVNRLFFKPIHFLAHCRYFSKFLLKNPFLIKNYIFFLDLS